MAVLILLKNCRKQREIKIKRKKRKVKIDSSENNTATKDTVLYEACLHGV